jgi:hypothetical protein
MITVTAINGRPQAQLPFQTEASDMLARPQPESVPAGARACGRNSHSIDLFGLADKVPDRGGSVRHATGLNSIACCAASRESNSATIVIRNKRKPRQ